MGETCAKMGCMDVLQNELGTCAKISWSCVKSLGVIIFNKIWRGYFGWKGVISIMSYITRVMHC